MPQASLNGNRIWYDVKGEGDYLLQIGGAGFAHLNFGRVTEDMAKCFTVIEMDQLGNGYSDKPNRAHSIELWADETAALLDTLGVERTHVHATSTGGMIAIRLAATYPHKVAGLVLGATAAKLDFMCKAQFEVRKALAQAFGVASKPLAYDLATLALSAEFLDGPDGGEGLVEEISNLLGEMTTVESWCSACDAMVEADLCDDLPQIQSPTLVICGKLDANTPLDQAPSGAGMRYIAENIPDAKLHVIEGAAHTTLLETPEVMKGLVIEFLTAVPLDR
jgi:pimeloyl-ACP methyl ester carboxylesterase